MGSHMTLLSHIAAVCDWGWGSRFLCCKTVENQPKGVNTQLCALHTVKFTSAHLAPRSIGDSADAAAICYVYPNSDLATDTPVRAAAPSAADTGGAALQTDASAQEGSAGHETLDDLPHSDPSRRTRPLLSPPNAAHRPEVDGDVWPAVWHSLRALLCVRPNRLARCVRLVFGMPRSTPCPGSVPPFTFWLAGSPQVAGGGGSERCAGAAPCSLCSGARWAVLD